MLSYLTFAFRQLRKSPGFALTAILTLALGIGACTAMFSVVNAVLLRPLPFRNPADLVWIENIGTGGLSARTSRVDNFLDWRAQSKSFESLGAYFAFFDYNRITLVGGGEPQRLRGVGVSENFLDVLGVKPLYGRNFTPDECKWNGPKVALLSHAFWQQRFAGDPRIVGQTLTLNNEPTTIIGVLPRTFDFSAIFTPGTESELLIPFPLAPETAEWGNTVFGIGRLRPGVTLAQAQAELDVINDRLIKEHPERFGGFGARLSSIDRALRGKFRSPFLVLAGAVACVLAIACVNLSNLLLARINARRQEFAVRVALGARRRHLVQQTLTESLLLAFAGCLVGVPAAIVATASLARLRTFGVPLLEGASVDLLALAVTILLTTIAGVVCGVLPALHLSGDQPSSGLQNATHQRTGGRTSSAARNALVVAEVALACVLLVGAGLLFRSFNALLQVNLGFQPQQAMAWRVDPPRGFANNEEATHYLDGVVQSVASLPGVESVGLSDTLPLGRNRTWGAGAKGVQYPRGKYPFAFPRIVDHGYLQAMRIPLRAGRYFDERDTGTSEKGVIINETLARVLWPDHDPIGQVIEQNADYKVIGVVGSVRHGSLEVTGDNEMYFDYHQMPGWPGMEMVVRSGRSPESLAPEVRAALAKYDPALPNGEFYQLEQLVDNAVAPRRLITQLLGFFSLIALALAAIGLYGVISYSVVQRTQEIGIRMAIGAQRHDVLQLILQGGLRLVAIGLVFGLIGALWLTSLLDAFLFNVTAHDPWTFGSDALILLVVATLACLVPAFRATRVDPMAALRAD